MNAYDTPESRRHEWQCKQGRGHWCEENSAAAGFVVWTMGLLSLYAACLLVVLA